MGILHTAGWGGSAQAPSTSTACGHTAPCLLREASEGEPQCQGMR